MITGAAWGPCGPVTSLSFAGQAYSPTGSSNPGIFPPPNRSQQKRHREIRDGLAYGQGVVVVQSVEAVGSDMMEGGTTKPKEIHGVNNGLS
jgi:hypothetical protein